MSDYILYFGPGTCSIAPMIALEHANASYDTKVIAYMHGDHRTPDFLELNPNGKTPLLIAHGRPIYETSAILYFLALEFPNAELLPRTENRVRESQIIADMIWCSSELHGNVFRIRIPQFFCDSPDGRSRQREMAVDTMHEKFAIIEKRLSSSKWFLAEGWSVIDAYLFWVYFRLEGTVFDGSVYSSFHRHYERMQAHPSVVRARTIEMAAGKDLAQRGLKVNFDTFRPGKTPADFKAQIGN